MSIGPFVKLGLATIIAGACATAPPPLAETRIAPQERLAPPPPPNPAMAASFDPKALASQMVSASECAQSAREIRPQAPERGWAALVACVERGRFTRGDFTDLRLVLSADWEEDLLKRPDAPKLLAKMVAMRGGDVDGDLKTIQEKRVPLFTLTAAMKSPDMYQGRLVVVRGVMEEAKSQGGKLTAKLAEHGLKGVMRASEVEGDRGKYTSTSSGQWKGAATTSRYGNAKANTSYSNSRESTGTEVRKRYENEMAPTGRNAIARIVQPDPFLEPGKSYIFLVKFEGVRRNPEAGESEAERETDKIAVVSIISYFQHAAMLVD